MKFTWNKFWKAPYVSQEISPRTEAIFRDANNEMTNTMINNAQILNKNIIILSK